MGCWILGRADAAVGRTGGRGFSSAAIALEKLASSPKSSSIAQRFERSGNGREYQSYEAGQSRAEQSRAATGDHVISHGRNPREALQPNSILYHFILPPDLPCDLHIIPSSHNSLEFPRISCLLSHNSSLYGCGCGCGCAIPRTFES